MQTVFEPGEKVICLVMSLDDDFSNISLSTAEIEPEDGDIVKNKEAVWAQAAEQSEAFRRDMLAAR